MTGSPLPEAILNPSAIALVGASTKEGSTGNTTLANILKSRFHGRVYPVNPKADEILGVRAYASVESIPERIDLVLVAVPAPAVPQALAESAAHGARPARRCKRKQCASPEEQACGLSGRTALGYTT